MAKALRVLLAFSLGLGAVVFALQPLEFWLGPLLLLPDLRLDRLRRYGATVAGVLAAVLLFLSLGRASAGNDTGAGVLHEEFRLLAQSRFDEMAEGGRARSALGIGWTSLAIRDAALLAGTRIGLEAMAWRAGRSDRASAPGLGAGLWLAGALLLRLAAAGAIFEFLRARLPDRVRLRIAGVVWGALLLLYLSAEGWIPL